MGGRFTGVMGLALKTTNNMLMSMNGKAHAIFVSTDTHAYGYALAVEGTCYFYLDKHSYHTKVVCCKRDMLFNQIV